MAIDTRYSIPGIDTWTDESGSFYWQTVQSLYYDNLRDMIANYPSGAYGDYLYDQLYYEFYREAGSTPPQQADSCIMFPSQFYELVYNLVEQNKTPMEAILKNKIVFAPAYPEVIAETLSGNTLSVDKPTKQIGFWIVAREKLAQPGGWGGPMFTGTKEVKFRTREFNIKNPDNIYETYSVLGQAREYLIQFDIFAPTNYEVELLTQWFDLLMFSNIWYFRKNGVVNMIWMGHVEDTKFTIRPRMAVTSTQYGIRLELLAITATDSIKQIDINSGTNET